MVLHDIVVGLDDSSDSADALRWAEGFASATSASVRALTSWQMPLVASLPSMIGGLPSQAFMANRAAESLHATLLASGVPADFPSEVREGHPGEILAAETAEADLVVVGRTGSGRRHGISRLAEVVLGSVARHCIHNATGPVAAVPSGQPWVDNPVVVVGVDGSLASHAALAWAVEHLPAGASIHAVRSIPPYLEGLLALDTGLLEQVQDSTTRELHQSIRSALSEADPAAIERVQPHLIIDLARNALLQPGFAVDLLIVGARGRGALAARMLGSVSDHVVRHASCPVIVVPDPQESE